MKEERKKSFFSFLFFLTYSYGDKVFFFVQGVKASCGNEIEFVLWVRSYKSVLVRDHDEGVASDHTHTQNRKMRTKERKKEMRSN